MNPERALIRDLRKLDREAAEARERKAIRHARIAAFCGSWAVAIALVGAVVCVVN